MDRVLAYLKEFLNTHFQLGVDGATYSDTYGLIRIDIGMLNEVIGDRFWNDVPWILISPISAPVSRQSFWGNHNTVEYKVRFTIAQAYRNFRDARVPNESKVTLNQIETELRRALGTDKKLGGLVTLWSDEWDARPLNTDDGFQLLEITTHWIDDLVPWDGPANNQTNLTPL